MPTVHGVSHLHFESKVNSGLVQEESMYPNMQVGQKTAYKYKNTDTGRGKEILIIQFVFFAQSLKQERKEEMVQSPTSRPQNIQQEREEIKWYLHLSHPIGIQ